MKKKKTLIVGIMVLILIGVIGITRAFLSTGTQQQLANSFSSGCLNITIESESAALTLNNIKPVTDVEGLDSDAYTFTINNNCSQATNYQVNLESLNETSNSLSADYLKVALSSDTMDNIISILGNNPTTRNTITGSYESHELYKGTIQGNTTKTYSLKMWMDYDTTASQGASKTFTSKINVIANPNLNITATPEIKTTLEDLTLTGTITGTASTASYCITTNNVCIPNTNTTITNNETSITLSETENKEIVCTNLNNNKIYCTNPITPSESDFNILAINIQSEAGSTTYNQTNTIPTSGYVLGTEEGYTSYCIVNGEEDEDVTITYENGEITISHLTSKTKCYLYFDIFVPSLSNSSPSELANSSCTSMTISGTGGTVSAAVTSGSYICKISDGMYTTGGTYGDGYTYVFRGATTNNWVKFAGMYWRIVRINGDGSIRMIYSGTTAPTSSQTAVMTGTGTQTTTKAFNSSYNNNMYVGWKYTSGNAHGTGTDSAIRDYLLNASSGWYSSSGLSSYASYLADGKFCNDRYPSTSNSTSNGSGGTGTTETYYGAYIRMLPGGSWGSTQTFTTGCQTSSDIFTEKVGLITADEVLMAGGKGGTNNTGYYLYTNQAYWTMSPGSYNANFSAAGVFAVDTSGSLGNHRVDNSNRVRPVINLKAGTKFNTSTDGTYSKPYELSS